MATQGHHIIGIAHGKDASFPGTLVSIDLDDRAATEQGLAELAARHDIDDVVNNVGLVRLHQVGGIDLADVDDAFRTNIHSTVQTVNALLPGSRRLIAVMGVTALGQSGLRIVRGGDRWPPLPVAELMVGGEDGPAGDMIRKLGLFLADGIGGGAGLSLAA